jgi:hypothetical protein
MAFPTALNDLVTDSVASTNVEVVSLSPAISMGELYQATAQALSNAAHYATHAQQQGYVTAEAVTLMGVARIYGVHPSRLKPARVDILSS